MPETLPSLQDLAELAEQAYAEIPRSISRHADDIMIRVVDLPDEETCRDLELDSPYDLLGLYRGVHLAEKSSFDLPYGPDEVYLYRLPLLREWQETGGDFSCLVREVLLHEIGHHFGFSDEAMERICDEARRG